VRPIVIRGAEAYHRDPCGCQLSERLQQGVVMGGDALGEVLVLASARPGRRNVVVGPQVGSGHVEKEAWRRNRGTPHVQACRWPRAAIASRDTAYEALSD